MDSKQHSRIEGGDHVPPLRRVCLSSIPTTGHSSLPNCLSSMWQIIPSSKYGQNLFKTNLFSAMAASLGKIYFRDHHALEL